MKKTCLNLALFAFLFTSATVSAQKGLLDNLHDRLGKEIKKEHHTDADKDSKEAVENKRDLLQDRKEALEEHWDMMKDKEEARENPKAEIKEERGEMKEALHDIRNDLRSIHRDFLNLSRNEKDQAKNDKDQKSDQKRIDRDLAKLNRDRADLKADEKRTNTTPVKASAKISGSVIGTTPVVSPAIKVKGIISQ